LYYYGQGLPQDYEEAALWYRKSAEQGYAPAQRGLGNLCLYGWGVPQDAAESAIWFRKAADQGDEEAQQMLGVLYGDGSGVPQDYEEAYFWLSLAVARMGDAKETYAELIGDIAENLSPSQLSNADERVSQWILDHPPQASDQTAHPLSILGAYGISTEGAIAIDFSQ